MSIWVVLVITIGYAIWVVIGTLLAVREYHLEKRMTPAVIVFFTWILVAPSFLLLIMMVDAFRKPRCSFSQVMKGDW